MRILKLYITITVCTILMLSCEFNAPQEQFQKVNHIGALKTIMSGNITSVINLDSLANKEHLYALGAAANLEGEIQIFDGQPSNSYVADSSLHLSDNYKSKAALLVYAQVAQWEAFTLENITTKEQLEKVIFKTAANYKLNTEQPFPFLLEGSVARLDWHVINWKKGDSIHSHKKHKESGLNGTLENKAVQILGFYSSKHKAIFTHHTTNMHLHFKTDDLLVAGHLDDLQLDGSITLKLPKQ
jgi:acetolactate decarboxylase